MGARPQERVREGSSGGYCLHCAENQAELGTPPATHHRWALLFFSIPTRPSGHSRAGLLQGPRRAVAASVLPAGVLEGAARAGPWAREGARPAGTWRECFPALGHKAARPVGLPWAPPAPRPFFWWRPVPTSGLSGERRPNPFSERTNPGPGR